MLNNINLSENRKKQVKHLMVKFEDVKSTEIKFGKNDFIQVARKKAISDDGENVFLSLSRGFFGEGDERIWKKNFSIPDNPDVLDKIIKALQDLQEE